MSREENRRPFGEGRRTERGCRMYEICANYTSMTKLVRETRYLVEFEFPLAKKSETDFRYLDHGAVEMRWVMRGASYRAYLAALAGLPFIAFSVYRDGEQIHRDVVTLSLQELRSRGMLRKEARTNV